MNALAIALCAMLFAGGLFVGAHLEDRGRGGVVLAICFVSLGAALFFWGWTLALALR